MFTSARPYLLCGLGLALLAVGIVTLSPFVATGLLCVAGLLSLCGFYCFIRDHLRRRDPYSLAHLRLVDGGQAPQPDEPEDIEDFDSVMCPHCSTVYTIQLPACPRCGQPPHTSWCGNQ